ncbi:uncharacterized protein [Hyperolius riggenbachi]|uniref:uncharacterized protein isoform X1 n=1 Tax=Hyperolius riggenbachi TaxID=752182 RepID=UPI0035A349FE
MKPFFHCGCKMFSTLYLSPIKNAFCSTGHEREDPRNKYSRKTQSASEWQPSTKSDHRLADIQSTQANADPPNIEECLIEHGACATLGPRTDVDQPPTIEDPDGVPLPQTAHHEASTLEQHPRTHEETNCNSTPNHRQCGTQEANIQSSSSEEHSDRLGFQEKKKAILKRLHKTEADVHELNRKVQKLQHIEQLSKKLEEDVAALRTALVNL